MLQNWVKTSVWRENDSSWRSSVTSLSNVSHWKSRGKDSKTSRFVSKITLFFLSERRFCHLLGAGESKTWGWRVAWEATQCNSREAEEYTASWNLVGANLSLEHEISYQALEFKTANLRELTERNPGSMVLEEGIPKPKRSSGCWSSHHN